MLLLLGVLGCLFRGGAVMGQPTSRLMIRLSLPWVNSRRLVSPTATQGVPFGYSFGIALDAATSKPFEVIYGH